MNERREAPEPIEVRAEDVEQVMRSGALNRPAAIVGGRARERRSLLAAVAHRLAADGLPAVLFVACGSARAPAAAMVPASIPTASLARRAARMGLVGIAASPQFLADLQLREESLTVLIDQPARLRSDERHAVSMLLDRPRILLAAGWAPDDWSTELDRRLDEDPLDHGSDLVAADLIVLPPLAPEESRRMLTLCRRIGRMTLAAQAGARGPRGDDEPPPRPERVPRDASAGDAPLTRREREIAVLIAEGLTNRMIAERLSLSPRTVETHVLQARAKVGAGTRAALAAAILRGSERRRRG